MSDTDLWNMPIGAFKTRRKTPIPRGHAGSPGSGPKGESCKTCQHLCRIKMGKTYLKCILTKSQWTCGPGSDVRAKDAACWKWESKTSQSAT